MANVLTSGQQHTSTAPPHQLRYFFILDQVQVGVRVKVGTVWMSLDLLYACLQLLCIVELTYHAFTLSLLAAAGLDSDLPAFNTITIDDDR